AISSVVTRSKPWAVNRSSAACSMRTRVSSRASGATTASVMPPSCPAIDRPAAKSRRRRCAVAPFGGSVQRRDQPRGAGLTGQHVGDGEQGEEGDEQDDGEHEG